MSDAHPVRPGQLILVPALITLAVTALRLVGELQGWSPLLFSKEAGGGGALVGISWLVVVFGAWFGWRLARAGQGPGAIGRALGLTILAFALLPDLGFAATALGMSQQSLSTFAVYVVGSIVGLVARPAGVAGARAHAARVRVRGPGPRGARHAGRHPRQLGHALRRGAPRLPGDGAPVEVAAHRPPAPDDDLDLVHRGRGLDLRHPGRGRRPALPAARRPPDRGRLSHARRGRLSEGAPLADNGRVHELSIAVSLVEMACEKAKGLGDVRVEALHLRVGALSGCRPRGARVLLRRRRGGHGDRRGTAAHHRRAAHRHVPELRRRAGAPGLPARVPDVRHADAPGGRRQGPRADRAGGERPCSPGSLTSARGSSRRTTCSRASCESDSAEPACSSRASCRARERARPRSSRRRSRALKATRRVAALVGDLATDNDARRLERPGVPVRQITTGTVCHLEAQMVEQAPRGLGPRGARPPVRGERRQPRVPGELRPRRGPARGAACP